MRDLARPWLVLKEQATKPSTYAPLESAWRNHVEPRWGHVRLSDLDTVEVEKWIGEMRATDKSATVILRAYGIRAGIGDMAMKERRLSVNPVRGVENLPRKTRREHVYLTHDQVKRFADATGTPVRELIVYTLAYTGLRWGELVALQVQDLDLAARRVRVRRNAVEVGAKIRAGTPKNHEARTVPLPAFLAVKLGEHTRGLPRASLVFPGDDGGYLRRSKHARGWFARAVKRAGLPDMSPHDLRHTAASLAISAGAHVKVIQRMLGHASASMTLDTYADLFDGDLDGVARALDSARRTAIVGKTWADATHLGLVRI